MTQGRCLELGSSLSQGRNAGHRHGMAPHVCWPATMDGFDIFCPACMSLGQDHGSRNGLYELLYQVHAFDLSTQSICLCTPWNAIYIDPGPWHHTSMIHLCGSQVCTACKACQHLAHGMLFHHRRCDNTTSSLCPGLGSIQASISDNLAGAPAAASCTSALFLESIDGMTKRA